MYFLVVRLSGRSKKEGRFVVVRSSFLGERSLRVWRGRNLVGEGLVKSSISLERILLLCFLLNVRFVSRSSLNSTGSSSQLSSLDYASSLHPTFIRSLLVQSSLKTSGFSSLLQKYFLRVRQILLPTSLQCLLVKWNLSLMELQKECSMVQLQGRLSIWWTDSLEVPSLPSLIPKLHWQQLKEGISFQKRQGICLEMQGLVLFWQPQINIPFFLECACRSMNIKQFFCSKIALFVKKIYGLLPLLSKCQTRLRSYPERLHLQLPLMTPSGLSMGTILKIKYSLSLFAYSQLETRKLMTPSHTKEAGVYPGCTLLVIKTTFFSLLLLKLVIVSNQTQFPPGDYVSVFLLKMELQWLSLVMLRRKRSNIVKVQGGLWAKYVTSFSLSKSQVNDRVKQVFSPPILILFLRYLISYPLRSQQYPLLSLHTDTLIPFSKDEQFLCKLRIWKRTLPLYPLLCTLKKNHWVHREVLISFCSSKQYQLSSQDLQTMARLPLQNRLSKEREQEESVVGGV